MFTYILYIMPLSETAKELCDSIEAYKKEILVTEVYSDTECGICIGVNSANEVDLEEVIWDTLKEGVIPHGNYWSIHIGYTSMINKKFLKDKFVNKVDYKLPEDEETEIVDKDQKKYPPPSKLLSSTSSNDLTWRFL